MAREVGFAQVSVSHEVAPLIKLVPRGDTTVVDAYLSPVLRRYTDMLREQLPEARRLHFMQSNGGLAEVGAFRGKDAILSGPAGGVVGMVAASEPLGYRKLIGFDMGGTSTDVAHYAGDYELTGDSVVAGVRVASPMMRIHTVAAGGGSICSFDGARFRVGPHSAGADPGPACYRRGGPLTVTDCNLALGRIDPAFFPAVFGNMGDEPLDPAASRARLSELAATLPEPRSPEQIAEGFLAIAVDQHGQRHPEDQRRQGTRRHYLCTRLFRWCGRATCLQGGGRARDRDGAGASARGHAFGLWDRARTGEGDPRGERAAATGRSVRRSA